MTLGLRQRYYCTNVVCPYCSSDHPYFEDEFQRNKGLCRGRENDGCGMPLVKGDPLDTRARWIMGLLAAALVAWALTWSLGHLMFPDPVRHVAFAATETRTQATGALLDISLMRNTTLDTRVTIRFESIDGSARAGQDYEPIKGEVTFEPGERQKTLSVILLPDTTFQKGERHFSVQLPNVVGSPRHVVFIEQRKVDQTAQAQAEQVVRAASVIAKDIADHVVRQKVIVDLLAASRSDPDAFRRYQEALHTTQGNLSRARESYAQFFRDMNAMQPLTVLQAMDTVSGNLDHQGFKQQAKATAIMKRQFEEYLTRKAFNMDHWVLELSEVVPRLPSRKSEPST